MRILYLKHPVRLNFYVYSREQSQKRLKLMLVAFEMHNRLMAEAQDNHGRFLFHATVIRCVGCYAVFVAQTFCISVFPAFQYFSFSYFAMFFFILGHLQHSEDEQWVNVLKLFYVQLFWLQVMLSTLYCHAEAVGSVQENSTLGVLSPVSCDGKGKGKATHTHSRA